MTTKLKPQRLKGFPDFFAGDVKLREYVIAIFKKNFEKYGYEPLETPALELTEMMVGISGSEAEKQFYRFQDPGKRDVMLKYEVMTAMCRAVAENINTLPLPYKRYQIQKVWRAENTQKGRYREFTQCDADTIGSSSMQCDAEFIEMGLGIVKELGFTEFEARISNRKFLEGLAEYVGIVKDQFYGFCMSLDKLKKIGAQKVLDEMANRDIPKDKAEKALEMVDDNRFLGMGFNEILDIFGDTVGSTKIGGEALNELKEIGKYFEISKVDPKLYRFDPSLARGLASYTGPVWEFEVKDGGVGSIAGCGRYDNVIGKYIGRDIPATGGSFGIERVCDIIKDRNMFDLGQTTTDILVTVFDEGTFESSLRLAQKLRQETDKKVMVYPEAEGLGKQLKYADKKGIPMVVVLGPDEIDKRVVQIKDMKTGEKKDVTVEDLIKQLK